MKPFLIVLNTVLLALLLWSVSAQFDGGEEMALPTRSDRQKTAPTATAPEGNANLYDASELVPVIAGNNIFDPQRAPNADPGQRNVELTLVGTFQLGEKEGAIILQQARQRRNDMMPPGMGGDGMQQMGMAMPEEVQQRIAEYRNARFGSPAAAAPATQNYSFKQYVAVGDSLESGYTLTEISDKKAILTRGSERLELTLADPSKNAPATTTVANNANRPRGTDMFRAMQSAQMFQNMQMMRMMQMMMQQQQRAAGGNAAGGRGGSAGLAPAGGNRGGGNMGGGNMGGGNMGGGSSGSRTGTGGRTGGRTAN